MSDSNEAPPLIIDTDVKVGKIPAEVLSTMTTFCSEQSAKQLAAAQLVSSRFRYNATAQLRHGYL